MKTAHSEHESFNLTREQTMSALFASLVIQQTNTALMFLGKVPHPETGETFHEVESARMVIDQLEMLECKTKGNLDKNEESLLRQSLTELRLAFVQAVEEKPKPQPVQNRPPATAGSEATTVTENETRPGEEESRKKFSKKY